MISIAVFSFRYKDNHLALFTGFLPAIDACEYDWPSTEIKLCSHIVRKASEVRSGLSPAQTIVQGQDRRHDSSSDALTVGGVLIEA